MYDCPGTGGRGCEICADWEGRTFADIRNELAGISTAAPAVVLPAPRTPEAPPTSDHAEHCDRLFHEGGTCTCDSPDDYDREPANMADLEDGIDANW